VSTSSVGGERRNVDDSPEVLNRRSSKINYRQRLRAAASTSSLLGASSSIPTTLTTSETPATVSPIKEPPTTSTAASSWNATEAGGVPPEVVLGHHGGGGAGEVSPLRKPNLPSQVTPPRNQRKMAAVDGYSPPQHHQRSSGYVTDSAVPMVRRQKTSRGMWTDDSDDDLMAPSDMRSTRTANLRKERLARHKQTGTTTPTTSLLSSEVTAAKDSISPSLGAGAPKSAFENLPASKQKHHLHTVNIPAILVPPKVDAADRGGGVPPSPPPFHSPSQPPQLIPSSSKAGASVASNSSLPPSSSRSRASLSSLANKDAAIQKSRGVSIVTSSTNPDDDDDMSSLGRDEQPPLDDSLLRLTNAVQTKTSARPSDLNMDQKALWDAVQTRIEDSKSEAISTQRTLESKLTESTNQLQRVRTHNEELQKELDESSKVILKLQQDLRCSSPTDTDPSKGTADEQLRAMEEESLIQQEEHDRAIRAIQRVLADVSLQKEEEVEHLQKQLADLKEEKAKLESQMDVLSSKQINTDDDVSELKARSQRAKQLESEMDELKTMLVEAEGAHDQVKKDMELKAIKVTAMELDAKRLRDELEQGKTREKELTEVVEAQTQELNQLREKMEQLTSEAETFKDRERELKIELEGKERQIRKLHKMRRVSTKEATSRSVVNTEEVTKLEKALDDKDKSLEEAKLLITSLESANGSMSKDLRHKLKEKEENVVSLRSSNDDKQRKLDSLAVELRDLQNDRANAMNRIAEITSRHRTRQRTLAKKLSNHLLELQSSSTIHETMPGDPTNVAKIGDVLSSAIMAIKINLSSTDNSGESSPAEEKSDGSTGGDTDIQSVSSVGGVDPAALGRQLDSIIQKDREATAHGLRADLEEKTNAIAKLEVALRKERDEMEMMQMQHERQLSLHEETEQRMNTEIHNLREQCQTNMELLTVKEQELQVLRDSLAVNDDVGVGYISGDDSDDEEQEAADQATVATAASQRSGAHTPYQQTQALATILAQGGNGMELAATGETNTLKAKLLQEQQEKELAQKELQTERESLANAKMIISSLEKANKNMLEDLRSRLQESNTAISSLLDKSVDNENQSAELKAELDQLKKQKEAEAEQHRAELEKLKDEALVSALRLAAKDREIDDLRKTSSSSDVEESKSAEGGTEKQDPKGHLLVPKS